MSKFINTQHKKVIDSLVDGLKQKLDNPYYVFTDKKASIVDYYNINVEKSTLDEASKLEYSAVGNNNPKKFNLIKDAYLFGIERLLVDLDNNEYGLESNTIEAEAIVLPNTFTPYPGDYFKIIHTDKNFLFKVLSVNTDTLESGANFYKLSFKLDQTNGAKIDDQVVSEYRMIVNNVGTKYNPIIRSNDYNLIESLDNTLITLKKYYKNLFFNGKVQTFTFKMDGYNFYDPYLIEFIIRNKLMEGDDQYIYVSHQTYTNRTFAIDYDKTFFRSIELGDKQKLSTRLDSIAQIVEDPNSLLSTRIEDYYKIEYIIPFNSINVFNGRIQNFDMDMINKIISNNYYEADSEHYLRNIIIDYFNDKEFKSEILDILEAIDYNCNLELFYAIPIIIYIIEYYIKNLLK